MNEQPRGCASGKCGNHAGRFPRPTAPPRNIEFFVRYPDGTDSDPGSLGEIRALAEASGGHARARAKRDG